MAFQNKQYSRAFYYSLALHGGLLAILFMDIGLPTHKRVAISNKPQQKIVKAVTVNQKQVLDEISRIKSEKVAKQKAEERRQKRLDQQAAAAKKKRRQEQARLRKLKQQLQRAEKQRLEKRREAERALAKIKKQKQAEIKRLAKIKKEQQALRIKRQQDQKRKADLAAKRKAEAERAKKIAAQKAQLAAMQGEINKYKSLILQAIAQNWIVPDDVDPHISCRLRIRLAANGAVLSVSISRSSGNRLLDRSAEIAVYKASPLPVPSESDVFEQFRELNLTVRPEDVMPV